MYTLPFALSVSLARPLERSPPFVVFSILLGRVIASAFGGREERPGGALSRRRRVVSLRGRVFTRHGWWERYGAAGERPDGAV